MKIFSGTANQPLAGAICKSIGLELGKCTIVPFPDGETFVKINEATEADFRKATQRVWRTAARPSFVRLSVVAS